MKIRIETEENEFALFDVWLYVNDELSLFDENFTSEEAAIEYARGGALAEVGA